MFPQKIAKQQKFAWNFAPVTRFFSTIPSGDFHQVLAHHHHPPALHGRFPFWLGRIGPLFLAAGTDIINRPHWFNWSRLQFYMSQICWSNKIKSYPAWLLQNCPISASPEITRNKGTATPLRSRSRAAHQHVMMNNDEQPFSNASPILPAANCHTWETNLAYQYNTVYSILCLRPGVVQNQHMLDLDITRERYACEKHPKPPKRSFMKSSSFSACPLLFAGA